MHRAAAFAAAAMFLLSSAAIVSPGEAQTFAKGQDVSPTFDGWQRNADGTINLYFGYFNRNSDEFFDVPVGPENNIDGGDRGQPTHFYPGRRWWLFKMVVPADWPRDRRVVWTLTTQGTTSQAKGWLQPEWEVDQDLMTKNAPRDPFLMIGGGGDSDADHENRAPSITVSPAQTISVADTLTLTATATDDGRPKPAGSARGSDQGVRLRWMIYRAPGAVRLDPEVMSGRVYGKPATLTTKVRFASPGLYRLRVIASDGQAFSMSDVDVTVK
jgi:hypothetical protein